MANVRNYEEYRAEVLDTLVATVEDLRNEPSFRAKVLETLGVEFTDEDTRNFERYRLKALEGLKNGGGSGGGGSSDLSIATLRFINDSATVMGAIALDTDSQSAGSFSVGSFEAETLKIILYKGSAMISIDRTVESTSGNIEDLGSDGYRVTGDCTITIS